MQVIYLHNCANDVLGLGQSSLPWLTQSTFDQNQVEHELNTTDI